MIVLLLSKLRQLFNEEVLPATAAWACISLVQKASAGAAPQRPFYFERLPSDNDADQFLLRHDHFLWRFAFQILVDSLARQGRGSDLLFAGFGRDHDAVAHFAID